jgi:hypothetical protein
MSKKNTREMVLHAHPDDLKTAKKRDEFADKMTDLVLDEVDKFRKRKGLPSLK